MCCISCFLGMGLISYCSYCFGMYMWKDHNLDIGFLPIDYHLWPLYYKENLQRRV
uniref:Choline/ethanolamine kinase n=1 Tax=Rhizophora mucronata TaxID=61149 RepID=A0A2P2KNT6_RHIMU